MTCSGLNGRRPAEIEDRPEVDEERIVALPGEHLDAARQRVDGRRRAGRRSSGSSAGRCCPADAAGPVPSGLVALPPVDPRDAVGLRHGSRSGRSSDCRSGPVL